MPLDIECTLDEDKRREIFDRWFEQQKSDQEAQRRIRELAGQVLDTQMLRLDPLADFRTKSGQALDKVHTLPYDPLRRRDEPETEHERGRTMNTRGINTYLKLRVAVAHYWHECETQAELAEKAGLAASTVSKYLPILEDLEPELAEKAAKTRQFVVEHELPKHVQRKLENDEFGEEQSEPKTEPKSEPKSEPKTETSESASAKIGSKAEVLQKFLEELTEPEVDEAKLREIVQEELERFGAGKIEITLPDSTEIEIEGGGSHEKLPEAIKILGATGRLALVGPTGSGKTTMAAQIAKALDQRFYAYSCTMGMMEGKLEGRLGFGNDYLPAPFVDFYENGGVIMLDEFDALNDNVRLILNNAIANDEMPVPNRIDNPVAKRHPDFRLVLGMNTWGDGASDVYTGRETIDGATRDRFALSKLWIDYDRKLEQGIEELGEWTPKATQEEWRCPKVRMSLGQAMENIRENIQSRNLGGKVLSFRNKLDAAKLKKAGFSDERVLEIYFQGWNENDRREALRGVAA